jgi:hypothetical protein
LACGVYQEGDGGTIGFLSGDLSNEVSAGGNVTPLVGTSKLKLAVVELV